MYTSPVTSRTTVTFFEHEKFKKEKIRPKLIPASSQTSRYIPSLNPPYNMTNQNGQLILQALQTISEPATISKIVTHIADTAGVNPNEVKESVEETLNGGVRYGYIQRSRRKYYAVPVDLEVLNGEEGSGGEGSGDADVDRDNHATAGQLEDRSRRKRSKRKRRSRKSRSRRRRR